MVKIWVYRKDEGVKTLDYPASLSGYLEDKDQIVWVDAEDPGKEELNWIQEQFQVHPIAMEDYTNSDTRARIDRFQTMYAIVFYALSFDEKDDTLKERPLQIFAGSSFLVTLHKAAFKEVREAQELWERNETEMECSAGVALWSLLDTLVDDYFPIIDHLADAVEDVEDQVLSQGKPANLDQIFHLKRQLLYTRRDVAPERDVLNVLLRREIHLFSEHTTVYYQDVYDHIVRILDSLDTHRDLLSGALDLYVSVLSNQLAMSANRLNITMQTLTAWSIILMSMALVTGIYGMNFHWMPELSLHYGYFGALAGMLTVGLGLFYYFKRRRWL